MTVQEVVSKQAILKAVNSMPEQIPVDALIDEIMYLYKIEIGLAQSREGRVVPLEEVKQKVKTWGKEK
jgi:predicted transcriptional regulator